MAEVVVNGVTYKLACSMSDCENNMHTFRSNKILQKKGIVKGCCSQCGSSLIDWERIHKRDISDFAYLHDAFRLEMIRNVFWSIKEPDMKLKSTVRAKSQEEIADSVKKRLRATLGKAKKDNVWDGRQTPFDGNLINWAQHATATCCRSCLEYWHGIDANAEITDTDYRYFEQIIMNYLDEKIKEH